MTDRILLGRLAAEFFVIVVGVLTAFAVDASWDNLQEEAETDRLLTAAVVELRVNLGRLEGAIGAHRAGAEAGFAILNLTGPGASAEAEAEVLELIPVYFGTPRTALEDIALSAALEAGILPSIHDEEVRRLFAVLPVAYENLARWEERIMRVTEEQFFPRMWLYVPQLNVEVIGAFGGAGPLWESFTASVPPVSRFEPDAAALLGDIIFENIVVERTTLLQVGQARATRIHEIIETVLEELDGTE